MKAVLLAGLLAVTVASTALAIQRPNATQSPRQSAPALKTQLTPQERGQIAANLVRTFSSDVYTQGGNVNDWAKKLGRAIGLADAINVQHAAQMPTLNAMMSVLVGQHVDSRAVKNVLAKSAKGTVNPTLIGDVDADLTFTPLPNGRCRVADSRVISSPLNGGVTRGIYTEQAGSYAGQGGSGSSAGQGSGNCGIPNFISSLVVSVTVLPTTSTGFFKIFANNQTFTDGNTVQWSNFGGVTNDVIVKSCRSCTSELAIYASGQTNYVIDVLGYFMPPQATALQCAMVSGTQVAIAPGGIVDAFGGTCPAGWTGVGGVCNTGVNQGSSIMDESFSPSGNQYNCQVWHSPGAASNQTAIAQTRCCRIPGR